MRPRKNLEHIPIQPDRDVLLGPARKKPSVCAFPYHRSAILPSAGNPDPVAIKKLERWPQFRGRQLALRRRNGFHFGRNAISEF
jgi:hypothetical protein